MARNNRPNRAAFGGAGAGADLAAFATAPAPGVAPVPAPAAVPAADVERPEPFPGRELPTSIAPAAEVDDYEDGPDYPDDEPLAPRKQRRTSPNIVRKNFPMEQKFIDELIKSRQQWHMADVSRMDHFNGGMASENAFLQAVARLGMERLERNAKDAERLLRMFPTNTRTR